MSIPTGDGLRQLQAALSGAVKLAGGRVDFPGFPVWEVGRSNDPGPTVIRSSALDLPVAEPDDAKRGAVSALATVQNGGTEFKFNRSGIIVPQPGAIGTYFARALSANVKGGVNRWASAAPGRLIGYDAQGASLFLGTDTVGGITPGGVYNLEFYAKPENISWPAFRDHIRAWTVANGTDMGTAAASSAGVTPQNAPFSVHGKSANGAVFDPTSIPGSASGTRLYIQSPPVQISAGFPPRSNQANSVICIADSAANAEAGIGTLITPGGDTTFEGVAFMCEVGNNDGGITESYITVTVL